jgi:hypothetical protein
MAGPRRRPRRPTPAARRIEIRLTDEEYRAVHAAAAGPGRGVSLARFVAEAALTAAGTVPAVPAPRRAPSRLVLAEVLEAVTALNRVGNNLNQLAREKNTTGLCPVGAREVEQRALVALARLAEVAERAAGDAT